MNSWLAFACALAALLGTRWHAGAPSLTALPWLGLAAWSWWSVRRAGRPGAQPLAPTVWLGIAAMAGFAMTMWTLAFAYPETSLPARAHWGHHPFGEHVVMLHAGLPWPGVEGAGMALASERIPFDMGVDALLFNFACWTALSWWGLRRVPRMHLPELVCLIGVAAACGAGYGGWQLSDWFD